MNEREGYDDSQLVSKQGERVGAESLSVKVLIRPKCGLTCTLIRFRPLALSPEDSASGCTNVVAAATAAAAAATTAAAAASGDGSGGGGGASSMYASCSGYAGGSYYEDYR